jgi:hypothetical protein
MAAQLTAIISALTTTSGSSGVSVRRRSGRASRASRRPGAESTTTSMVRWHLTLTGETGTKMRDRPVSRGRSALAATQERRQREEQLQTSEASEPEDCDRDCDRALDEAGRRSHFYGKLSGDLPEGAAPPLGWTPPNFVQLQEAAQKAERERMTRALHAGVPPPRRSDYATGEEGRDAFRADRRAWYERATGDSLEAVSVAEQHRLCHEFARRFRTYTDGRPDRAATPPPDPRPQPVAFPHSSGYSLCQHRIWRPFKSATLRGPATSGPS